MPVDIDVTDPSPWILVAIQGRIQDFILGGEPNNLEYRGRGTNERSDLRAKRVTSEASYQRSEYKSAVSPPRFFWNLEPLRVNLSVI